MVSKASEDLPDPDSPVMTTSWSRGMSTSTFLRLCSRAPRTEMDFCINRPNPKRLAMATRSGPRKREFQPSLGFLCSGTKREHMLKPLPEKPRAQVLPADGEEPDRTLSWEF